MKRTAAVLSGTLSALIVALGGRAWGITLSGFPSFSITPRTFTGAFVIKGSLDNIYGTLVANNPKCELSTPLPPNNGGGLGYGPNGSLQLNGSSECAGSYDLYFSDPSTSVGGGGVSSGTFAIVNASDQQTVVWAGTYTAVVNLGPAPAIPISPGGSSACGGTFCANLGANFQSGQFGSYDGPGVEFLVELNAFTWYVPQ